GEGDAGRIAHHEVVEHPDIDEGERAFQAAGDDLVGLARLGDPGRVVVGQDQRGGVLGERALDDLARVHAGAIDRAAKQFLERNHAVTIVQVQATEYFVRQVPQPRPEKAPHRV